MTTNDLYAYMEHPSRLSADTLPEMKALYEAYPYCSTFVFLYLYNMYVVQDVRYASELRRLAPYLPDRRKLYLLVEQYTHPEQLQPVSAEKEPDAFSLIDDFLDEMTRSGADLPSEISYGGASGIPSASDYFAATSPADQAEPSRSMPVLSVQAAGTPAESAPPAAKDPAPIAPADELDEGLFTETLARIYIKQGRYDKALRIIKTISLNYPEKNLYFADQIRFLEKLIINDKNKI